DAAVREFREALDLYPDHPASLTGLGRAHRALGQAAEADAAFRAAEHALGVTDRAKPVDSALLRGLLLAARGNADTAATVLDGVLAEAPPGFAGWTLPVEPDISQVIDTEPLTKVMSRLADRA